MAGIDLTSAGISLNYAVETTEGTRPTTGYKIINGIKTIPSMNPAPETLETTDLSAMEYKTYVDGLKDLGGALTFVAGLKQVFVDDWEKMMLAYETGKESKMKMWFCIIIPGLTEAAYFPGNPSALGVPGAGVNAVLETDVFITPNGEPQWAPKPTTT